MTINTAKQDALTHERLCALLEYRDGSFYWRVSRRCVKAGDRAGRQHGNGYRYIKLDQRHYMEHRLAWFYLHKEWPKELLDHENRTKNDNESNNVREATYSQNQFNRSLNRNNKSGIKGVSWCNTNKKWRVVISAFKKYHHIGFFENLEDAAAAHRKAALNLHGSFAA